MTTYVRPMQEGELIIACIGPYRTGTNREAYVRSMMHNGIEIGEIQGATWHVIYPL